MATITQLPAQLNYNGVAGNPATIAFNLSLTDANGNPIAWSSVSGYAVNIIDQYGNTPYGVTPSVTSPSSGKLTIAWTAAQTTLLSEVLQPRMSLSIYISGQGPYAIAAGLVVMTPSEYPSIPSPT
jgi:hypothetical protein